MKRKSTKSAIILAITLSLVILVSACGSGGGGSVSGEVSPPPEAPTTDAPAESAEGLPLADMSVVSKASQTVPYAEGMIDMPPPTIVPVPAGAEGKVWNLTLNDQGSDQIPIGLNELDAIKAIELRTNGQVQITPHFNSSLLEMGNIWPGVVQGMADISIYAVNMNAGAQPIHNIMNQPPIVPYRENTEMVLLVREFIEKHPEFKAENNAAGIEVISYMMNPSMTFHSTGKDYKTVEDIKGQRLIASASLKPYLDLTSSTMLAMPPGEYYTSLEKGVADGHISHWAIIHDFNLLDVYKSHTILGDKTSSGIFASVLFWIANKDTWNTIPVEYQEIIREEFDWVGYSVAQYNDAVRDAVIEDAKAMGHEVVYLSDEEAKPFYEISAKAVDVWAQQAETEGIPNAMGLYNEYMAAIEAGPSADAKPY